MLGAAQYFWGNINFSLSADMSFALMYSTDNNRLLIKPLTKNTVIEMKNIELKNPPNAEVSSIKFIFYKNQMIEVKSIM